MSEKKKVNFKQHLLDGLGLTGGFLICRIASVKSNQWSNLVKNLAAFLLCFWIFSSSAFTCEKPVIGLHTNTYHTDRSANYRENNMGHYFQCKNGFTAGSYNNSDWKHSDYVGYSKEFGYAKITVALISGYQTEPIVAVIPSVKIPGTPLVVAYLPQAPNKNNNTTGWHITIETSFK